VIVRGENFTDSSVVYFGDKKQTAKLIDRCTFLVEAAFPEAGTKITVAQISTKGQAVYTTPAVTPETAKKG